MSVSLIANCNRIEPQTVKMIICKRTDYSALGSLTVKQAPPRVKLLL